MPAEPIKPKPEFLPKAGTTVFARVGGKEIGPIYLVQIEGKTATLQGAETLTIPLSDIIAAAP